MARRDLVIGAELDCGGYWLVLFVVMSDGEQLTEDLIGRIKVAIRLRCAPTHRRRRVRTTR